MISYYEHFNEAFGAAVKDLMSYPDYICRPRGQEVREKLFYSFAVSDIRNRKVVFEARKWNEEYYFGELLWYLSGSDRLEDIQDFSSFWKNITDDGKTLNSAYGSRIFVNHPRIGNGNLIQWNYIIDTLVKDNDSRQAIIQVRSPSDALQPTKDMPCTLDLQFMVRDGKLNLIAHKRSTDVIFGLCYDAPIFMTIQEMMTNELRLKGIDVVPGTYYHMSNSLHIYQKHYDMAKTMSCENTLVPVRYPCISQEHMWESARTAIRVKETCQQLKKTCNSKEQFLEELGTVESLECQCPFFVQAKRSVVDHYLKLYDRKSE